MEQELNWLFWAVGFEFRPCISPNSPEHQEPMSQLRHIKHILAFAIP